MTANQRRRERQLSTRRAARRRARGSEGAMGDFDKACEIINDADVVLGLCDDGARHIIKGEEILKFIVASGVSEQLAVTYLPCRSLEEVEAIKRVWRERKQH
jgi:hypothetical protein